MTITYDPEKKRAMHTESGMWVEYLRDGQNSGMERDSYFRMGWDGKVKDFEASFNYGDDKLEKLYPDLDSFERSMRLSELKEINYNISHIGFDVKLEQKKNTNFPQIFVELVQCAVSQIHKSRKCSIYYRPYLYLSQGQWSAEG